MKIVAYCDGACSGNPGPGGWATIITNGIITKELTGHAIYTTNNRMELMAILETMKYYTEHINTETHKLDIYSDSAYAVNAIKKYWLKKWVLNNFVRVNGDPIQNQDLWKQIYEILKKYKDINLIKVKGHNGDVLNEKVDKLAKLQINKEG